MNVVAVLYLRVRMQVDQVNSEGLASAPWPARHNDPPRVTAVTCS